MELTNPTLLSIGGALIASLLAIVGFFLRQFIRRTEENDSELLETLNNLNATMNEINTNLLVFRTSATEEFKQINSSIEEIKEVSEVHTKAIEHIDKRVKVIETHHSRNHPQDKL